MRGWSAAWFALIVTGMAQAADPGADVASLLVEKCLTCHASDVRKGGLDLTRRAGLVDGGDSGPAIEEGDLASSLLLEKVEAGEMPPAKPLDAGQIEAVRAWVLGGATYASEPLEPRRAGRDWWALQPIRRPEPPAVQRADWPRTPVDRFVLERLEAAGLEPAPEADRRTLIRRLSLDLTGLAPAPETIAAFAADDRPDAYERLVDRLLASPAYGERWGRHWLDVVRFAESHGYETNQLRPNAWPYRDYVIRALNRDVPFGRFVAEQLAGDALPDADPLDRAATGFLVGGTHDVVGNRTVEGMLQQRVDDLDDMITATGSAFLGLTVNCARCHDHKFDPVAQRDYYALQAVFAGVQHAEREIPVPDADERREQALKVEAELARIDRVLDEDEPLARPGAGEPARPPVNSRRNVERFAPIAARFVRFEVAATNNGIEPCLDELEVWTAGDAPRNAALGAKPSASSTYPNSAIHRLEHLNDGRVGNGRSWISAEPGKGWVELDLGAAVPIERIVWGRDREERYRDRTPTTYAIKLALEPGSWITVAGSDDRAAFRDGKPSDATSGLSAEPIERRAATLARQKELRDRLARLGPTERIYAGTFAQPGPTHVLRRGDPQQQLDPVGPGAVESVRPALKLDADLPEAERRLALARWIADEGNPLPPRVMVNRLWHYHFGRGLVATPSDFGFNGDRPSHPELLDWLAAEFLEQGGRLKPIHRLIVLSAAYRQGSRIDPKAVAVDAGNRLLWRFTPRRLEAEAIRDAILAASGTLDRRMGGPGYWIWEPNTNYVVVFTPLEDLGPEHWRRMVYQYRPRSRHDPTFGAFDCPDGGLVAPRRNSSTTALQSLNLLNSRFVVAQAGRFAARVAAEGGPDPAAQVDRAFAIAFGREPDAVERAAAVDLVSAHGLPALGRALFNASEFLYLP